MKGQPVIVSYHDPRKMSPQEGWRTRGRRWGRGQIFFWVEVGLSISLIDCTERTVLSELVCFSICITSRANTAIASQSKDLGCLLNQGQQTLKISPRDKDRLISQSSIHQGIRGIEYWIGKGGLRVTRDRNQQNLPKKGLDTFPRETTNTN